MEQPREPRLYRNEQQRFSISSETEKTLQSIDSTLKRIEKLIIDEYEAVRQKGKILCVIEEIFRQVRFENPELASHIRKRMLQIAKEKGDLP